MEAKWPITVYSTFQHEFEKMSLLSIGLNDLDIFAFGEAKIAYDRYGDWKVEAISIYGRKGRQAPRLVPLPEGEPLYALVKQAICDCDFVTLNEHASQLAAHLKAAE
jgi:hypothetical protein